MKKLLVISLTVLLSSCGNFGKIRFQRFEKELKSDIAVDSEQLNAPKESISAVREFEIEQVKTVITIHDFAEVELPEKAALTLDQTLRENVDLIETSESTHASEIKSKENYPNYPKKRRINRMPFAEVLFMILVVIGIASGIVMMLGLVLIFIPTLYAFTVLIMRYSTYIFLISCLLGLIIALLTQTCDHLFVVVIITSDQV